MKEYSLLALWIFTLTYLFWGGAFFIQGFNLEFIAYIVMILVVVGGALLLSERANLPHWQLWLLSIWGLLHVLGGAIQIDDGVLFAYRIYPLLDLGGEFYILKYDQIVHMYFYGIAALLSHHVLCEVCKVRTHATLLSILAILVACGVGTLNEIIEFILSVNFESGVGGYANNMLDLIFNLMGAATAMILRNLFWKKLS